MIAIPEELFESDKIKGTEKLILLAMCRFKEKEKSEIVVTIRELSDLTGLTEQTVNRNILNMERRGILKSEYIKGSRGFRKMYSVNPGTLTLPTAKAGGFSLQ